ncbi:c-type cytochrome domain-containing protein [Mariniblastus fucicola]|uniref:WD domain, G-beta repeat n=1 Tax=Mariniblastus fucicola TaxID=980251 RepID=A0A5B9PH86_9BACT|nr:c-type cytochrome domain-containing protein [Mariniblastus fucicola]QEG24650.1 WD domain, G-beta repeat [Mariniblastus fucicola]
MKSFLIIAFWFFAASVSQAQDADNSIDFESQVAPILTKHCAGCHNEDTAEGDFSVDSFESIVAGSADRHIVKLMRGSEEPAMPPEDDFDRVPEQQIAIVERWIKEGAKPTENASKKPKLAIASPNWDAKTESQPSILAADWSPDGGTIAVARFGSVELFDAETLRPKHRFDSLPGKVNSVQFSADGKSLIAATGIAGVGGRALVWETVSHEKRLQIDGHNDVLYDAVVSPDGKTIATSAYDKTILLWDAATGEQLRKLKGHNSAVYDLEFSPDSKNLLSASGDQTIKVWNVASGQRLDTLGQPLAEQFTVGISPNGSLVVGGGRDNRLRVWKLASTDAPAINPILFSRFAHEAAIVRMEFSSDGSRLLTSAEDKMIKVWETDSFLQVGTLEQQDEICSAIAISPDAKRIFLGRLDGSMEVVDVPAEEGAVASAKSVVAKETYKKEPAKPVAVDEAEPNDAFADAQQVSIPVTVSGTIRESKNGADADLFRFRAKAGQSLMLETKAARDKSPVDTRIEVLHTDGTPVSQVVLRAVRDSYFTFRGKDSDTSDDFRVHNWQEMQLNEYLYANGEVNRLFLHPRGPDSGFRVFPGTGKRFGYFGTTAMSHALQEPCYVVEAWPPGTTFLPNGLPVFELNYENDDDSRRELGKDSRLKFVAPNDGDFLVRVTDVRGFGGEDFKYQLTVRETNPDFEIKFHGEKSIFAGSGSEFRLVAKRKDGFEGEIQIEVKNVPPGFYVTSPLRIEANHVEVIGAIHALDTLEGAGGTAKGITKEQADAISFHATVEIAGEVLSKTFHGVGEMKLEEAEPKVVCQIVRDKDDSMPAERDFDHPLVFEIRAGQSIQAHVVAKRNGHDGPIKFGNEGSGRNLPHGVRVDDLGLNGLMIPKGQNRQRFFIKAESFVEPQTRMFHLKVDNVNKLVCPPVILKVLPAE